MAAATRMVAAVLLSLVLAGVARASDPPRLFDRCEAEIARLEGHSLTVDQKDAATRKAPRKLRAGPGIDFSSMGERRGSGNWVGEALIDTDGTVTKVWTVRSPTFEPAWPEFDEIVAKDIRASIYEPTIVEGRPTRVCMAVSVLIDYK